MKKTIWLLALTGLAAMPAVAMQQPNPQQRTPARPGGLPHTVRGELTLYQMTNYNGESWVVDTASGTVRTEWNIRSVSVHPGDRWQICARPRFRDCIILGRNVPDATMIGVAGQIGSARPAPATAPAPAGN